MVHHLFLIDLLGDNNIGDNGAKEFSRALLEDAPIEELHLETNQITDRGAKSFISPIKKIDFEFKLFLGDNDISEDCEGMFFEAKKLKGKSEILFNKIEI